MGVVQPPTTGRDPSSTPQVSSSATSSPLPGDACGGKKVFLFCGGGKSPTLLHFPGPALAQLQGQSLCLPRRAFLPAKGNTRPTLVPSQVPHVLRPSAGRCFSWAAPSFCTPSKEKHGLARPRLTFIQQTAFKLHLSPGAAIAKSHIPGGLRQQTLRSPVRDARSPKSRHWHVPSESCESIGSRPSPGFWQVASGAPRLADGRLPSVSVPSEPLF